MGRRRLSSNSIGRSHDERFAMAASIQLWQFSVDDYQRMLESGILNEDDRVELIDGEVREMSPINTWHASTVSRLLHLLVEKLKRRSLVEVQNPIILNDFTAPQPDLVLLKWQDNFYADHTPIAEDAFVVVEIADTTLQYDRQEKLPRYAAAGIPEVWIVDGQNEAVEQYLNPQGGQYQEKKVIARGDRLVCRSIADLEIDGVNIFGS
jgi:Uma2 family endonuclease